MYFGAPRIRSESGLPKNPERHPSINHLITHFALVQLYQGKIRIWLNINGLTLSR